MTALHTPPAEITELNALFRRWQRRSNWVDALRWIPPALILGCWLAIALAIASRLIPLLSKLELMIWSVGILSSAALFVIFWFFIWPHSEMRLARRLERALHLQDRISTAMEIQAGRIHTSEQLKRVQLRDTLHHAASASPTTALPIRLSGRVIFLLAASLLTLSLLILLPNGLETSRFWQQQLQYQRPLAIEALEDARGSVVAEDSLSAEERERLLRAIDDAVANLENDAISREEAVASLYGAAQQLQKGQAALNSQSSAVQESYTEAAEALRRGEDPTAPDRPQSLSERLQEMREDLTSLSDDQLSSLAVALREAAEAFALTNPDLASALEAAAEALERGDLTAADEAMADAIFELQTTEANQERAGGDAQSMDRAAEQLANAAEELTDGSDAAPFNDQSGENGADTEVGRKGSQAAAGPAPEGEAREGAAQGARAAENNETRTETSAGQTAGAGDVTSGQSGDVSALSDGDSASRGNEPDGSGRGNYQTIYAPRERIEGNSQVGIELESGSSDILVDSGEFSKNPLGESRIPYTQLFHDYRDSANVALETEYIPLGLRAVIRSYFSAIEPETGG